MGTIAEKLAAVLSSKAAIKTSLQNKGKSPTDVFSTYAGLIDELGNISSECDVAQPTVITVTSKTRKDIAYGNGKFVIVSASTSSTNLIDYSTDGVTWTEANVPNAKFFASITYGNGLFVAIANDGSVIYSSDAITWIESSISSGNDWYAITYGNGVFIAVGEGTSCAISSDGVMWNTSESLSVSTSWIDIAYGDGKFVAVSETGKVCYSTDNGTSWTQGSNTESLRTGIAYGNGMFVTSGTNGTSHSSDGATWYSYNDTIGSTSIAFGKGLFVTGNAYDFIQYGVDGEMPYRCIFSNKTRINSIAYGDGKFVAVSDNIIVVIPTLVNSSDNKLPSIETKYTLGGKYVWEKFSGNTSIGFVMSGDEEYYTHEATVNGYTYRKAITKYRNLEFILSTASISSGLINFKVYTPKNNILAGFALSSASYLSPGIVEPMFFNKGGVFKADQYEQDGTGTGAYDSTNIQATDRGTVNHVTTIKWSIDDYNYVFENGATISVVIVVRT